MRISKFLGLLTLAAGFLFSSSPKTPAQIAIGIGVAPACPYGYFDYAPYVCAPYGYYGPDSFSGELFIVAGPWFPVPRGFYCNVDNRYDPRNGYHGPMPGRGEQAFNHFHANEGRDGQGHIGNPGHDGGGERSGGFQRGGGGGHAGGGGGHR